MVLMAVSWHWRLLYPNVPGALLRLDAERLLPQQA
ncbi:hypothetical protein SAMN05216605_12672 [Pseudomonas abietaniphila]|uniref:Uncharacterized protein n=1 Tax=Pseudomonas abietaniphila TaxID=89065 RepID=A0A1G8SWG4_9PSED|nr:hypothetical protein SAMN05216605_12672 [Pseudomonas abietaniphila]